MTSKEMVYSFQQLLLTISDSFFAKERLDTYEILDYLNRTVDRYIKTKYLSQQSFKANTAVISASTGDLKDLIVFTIIDPVTTFTALPGMTGAWTSNLPGDFFAYVRSDTLVSRDDVLPIAAPGKWIPNQEIDFNDIDQFLSTPFNSPILEKPLVTIHSEHTTTKETMMTITDIHTGVPLNNMLTYIKTPNVISIEGDDDCDLAEYLHEEIVNLAVNMYVEEYKTKLSNNKGE